jgi:hypothetical protein
LREHVFEQVRSGKPIVLRAVDERSQNDKHENHEAQDGDQTDQAQLACRIEVSPHVPDKDGDDAAADRHQQSEHRIDDITSACFGRGIEVVRIKAHLDRNVAELRQQPLSQEKNERGEEGDAEIAIVEVEVAHSVFFWIIPL